MEDAYIARFGQSAPVWSFLGHPGLVGALLEAMVQGQPWTAESLGDRLNAPRSPREAGK